ncbi:hypothetical protein EG68_09518 [Paragonimus skrjabini miyazakii]|uniref:Y+L amino acid transporter 2 n=1 Tax=Paragonimus skrjabini miyazakii TaxID=59628 RepID=A0A8S9YHL0_9TREM|nr:hypothetical protein EG68_09518 [Paragonimus skrjabini miyazakii]
MAPIFKNTKKTPAEDAVGLKKEIGVLQGVSIVVGIIVGSGIFVSPVGVLRNTQSVGLSFIMWFVTGLFSTLGAIVYAELGVTIPRSGGEYTYILETFGPFLAFMALWITFVVIGTVACAVNSLILAEYVLRPFFFDCDIPKSALQLVALLALLTLCFINCYRVTWATKLSIIFTTCKVVALLLIVGFGSYYLARGNVNSFKDPFEDSAINPGALANAFYQGFWAFAGCRPLSQPIISFLASQLQTFASQCMGVMAWVMPIFVGASVFGSINGEVLSMSRYFRSPMFVLLYRLECTMVHDDRFVLPVRTMFWTYVSCS